MVRELTGEDYLLHYVSQKWRSISFLITAFNVESPSEKKILEDLLVQMEKENFEDAIGYYKTVLQYDPKSSLVLNSIADSYENLSNKDMAIKYRKMVLVNFPNSFHYIMNLGSTCIFFGDYEEAKDVFLYCLEKFQDRAPYRQGIKNILFQLTITNYLLEDYKNALKAINVIVKLDPNNSVAIKLYEDIRRAKETSIKKDKAELYNYFNQEDWRAVSTKNLYQFEERLVKFIYHTLKEKFGNEWFNRGVPFKIKKTILNFKRYEKRNYKLHEYLGFQTILTSLKKIGKIFSQNHLKIRKKRIYLKH